MKFEASSLSAGLLLILAATNVNAQAVYRCGNTYSQVPCGQGSVVEATDPRSAAQTAEARRVAADERRLADEMQRDRLVDQAAYKPAGATSLSGRPDPVVKHEVASTVHHPKKKLAKSKKSSNGDFVAVDPSTLKKGKKK